VILGTVDRRTFIVTAVGLLAAPLAGEAQQAAKIARLGWLGAHPGGSELPREAFLQGLRDLGYVEGRNLVIEYRSAEGRLEQLPGLAAELVAAKVDVIVAPRNVSTTLRHRRHAFTVESRPSRGARGPRRPRRVVGRVSRAACAGASRGSRSRARTPSSPKTVASRNCRYPGPATCSCTS
jgi:hypothetical protein